MNVSQDRMNTLEYLTGPDMEYLWTAVEWEDILQKFSTLKIQDSALTSNALLKNLSFSLYPFFF